MRVIQVHGTRMPARGVKLVKQMLLSMSILGCGLAAPAMAQQANSPSGAEPEDGQIQDIVVTAERRQSTEQRTPAAISVRTGEDMLTQGRYTLRSIIQDVPGITGGEALNAGTSTGGAGTDNPAAGLVIRGIPSNLGTGGSITSTASSAAIYVDEVYNGVGGGYDIERVEVLRGPQGTLYGRSATSGVVAIRTRDPNTEKYEGDLTLETGSGDLFHATGAFNIPIVQDKVALRLSGNYYDRKGYRYSPGDDRSNEDFRAKLLIKPTDNFSVLAAYAQQYNTTQSGGGVFTQVAPDQYVFSTTVYGTGKNNSRQAWARVQWDLGPVVLTYIPAWRKFEQNAEIKVNIGLSATQTIRTPGSRFITNELRLASNYDSNLKWQVGAATYDNKLSDFNEFIADGDPPMGGLRFRAVTDKHTTAQGVFAEGTWSFRPDTRLTAGIRYDHTEVQTEQDYTSLLLITESISGKEGFSEFDNVTYKARLEHDLTPSNLLYASVSTGFAPGDITLGTDTEFKPEKVVLDAETLTAYEFGSKNRFFNNRLQLNAAIYYNDFSAYQLANVNFGTPQFPRFRTVALPLKTFGFELEAIARPWASGTFGANLSYTDSKFDLSEASSEEQAQFYTRRVYNIPKWRATVSYDHRFDLGSSTSLSLHGDVIYTSAYDTARLSVADARPDVGQSSVPYVRQGDFVVANLSGTLQLADGRYGITAYVRNVTDETYKLSASALIPTSSATLADPRTWGVMLTARF